MGAALRWLTRGMRRTIPSLVLLWAVAVPSRLAAQGLPFHTGNALTSAFEQRAVRLVVMGERRGQVDQLVSRVVLLPYAPTQRVTTSVTVPVVAKRLRVSADDWDEHAGFGDVTVGLKWAFLAHDRLGGTSRLALAGSASLPTGSTGARLQDGSPFPRSAQLGSGAFAGGLTLIGTVIRGRWGLNADLGHRRSSRDDGFRAGAATRYDLAIGFRVPDQVATIRTRTLQFYLEWNGVVTARSRDGDLTVSDSGGHEAWLSPGIQWVVRSNLLVEGSVQIPAVRNLNGAQPNAGVRPAIGARALF